MPTARTHSSSRAGTSARSCSNREQSVVLKAVITGGEGGLGRAMRARLEREGYEVESLDLVNGFDVTDPAAWERVEAVDLACLNAGVLTGEGDVRKLTDEQY